MKQLQEDAIQVYTRPEVSAATIWLHGLGFNSGDMDGIIANLRKTRALGLHYIAPNAPVRPITVNGGRPARAWFDVLGDPDDAPEDRCGIEASAGALREMFEACEKRGIPSHRILLGGYSQGAAMALHAGLRYPRPLAGIVVLSGELPLPGLLQREVHPSNASTPILMVHGLHDERIPVEDARRDRDRLLAQGLPVQWHELPIGHAVDASVTAIVDEWACRLLAAEAA
ncbi:MAG: phospholipase [Ectothiorhodospiraceae bacterium]|nr:phospholipase [Ectothiorhodospiraceae bacterium]